MRSRSFDPRLLIISLEGEGMSRIEIARQAGLAKSTITKLAQGDIQRPGHDTVISLQKLYGRFPAGNQIDVKRNIR